MFGVTGRLAGCFSDHRDPERSEHELDCLVAQRVMAIALGYEDLNDHDQLRDDSVLALAVGRGDITGADRVRERDRGHPLASSSTLNRLELGIPDKAAGDRTSADTRSRATYPEGLRQSPDLEQNAVRAAITMAGTMLMKMQPADDRDARKTS